MAKSRRRKPGFKLRLRWEAVIGILAAIVFIGAFIYYFASNFIATEREYAVYGAMDEPTLPLIYVISDAGVINPMYAHLQDMGNAAAPDIITPLPESRRLSIKIELYGNTVAGISYEIRNLSLSHFIERTEIDDYETAADGGIYLTLPIQNLLERDTPYLLNIKLDIGEDTVNYYTRIIWSGDDYIYQMIDTASEFTTKSFDYNAARDLTMYLETDESADNSSLGTVTLKSSFSQITWGNTGMKLASTPIVNVREYDGTMGAIELIYTSECVNEAGNTERYFNFDEYTLRVGSERLYIMAFERKTDQIFEGNKYLFTGSRIGLGIGNIADMETAYSGDGRFIAFKVDKELWIYDQVRQDAVNVFTYRSEIDRVRADNPDHDIKILSLSDEGVMDFVVYGYVNRGRHEGMCGIVYYRYDASDKALREIFFMPRAAGYQQIAAEVDELCVKANGEMLYLKQNDAIVAIDLISLEMLDIVGDLTKGRYVISEDQTMLAWVEGVYESGNLIRLMDLDKASTRVIYASDKEILSVVAFYGRHLIYGVSEEGDLWIISNTVRGLPARSLRIVDADLREVMRYEKSGLFFEDTVIEGNRIQITQYAWVGDGEYRLAGKDTVVSSADGGETTTRGISTDTSDLRKLVYFLDLDKTIRTSRTVNVSAPESISIEGAGTVELSARAVSSDMRYYAYSHGHLRGVAYCLRDAIELIYDDMGWVSDANSVVVYARGDKSGAGVIRDPVNAAEPLMMAIENGFSKDEVTDSGYVIINAADIPINRLLYYVHRGSPVLAMLGGDSYALIYGYTGDKIYIYYPSEEEEGGTREEMSLENAAIYFDGFDNDFIVFRDYPGNA